MAILNPFDFLEDVDHEDPTAVFEIVAKKKAEEFERILAEARIAAERENQEWEAKRKARDEANGVNFVKESKRNANAPRRGGRGGRGNHDNGSRRNLGDNGSVNGYFGGNGTVDVHHQSANGNGNYRGDYERPRSRQFNRENVNGNGSVERVSPRSHRPQNEEIKNGSDAAQDNKDDMLTLESVGIENDTFNVENEAIKDESNANKEKEEKEKAEKEKAEKEKEENEKEKEKEAEEKLMTLTDYEKLLEEKRKALLALKITEERKVIFDKAFESMQKLSLKKGNDEIFIKLDQQGEKLKEQGEKLKEQGAKQGSEKVEKDGKDKKMKKVPTHQVLNIRRGSYDTRPRRPSTEGYTGQKSSPAAHSNEKGLGNSQPPRGGYGRQRSSYAALSNENRSNGAFKAQTITSEDFPPLK